MIAGEHSIDVRLFNQSVYESPFLCNVGDPDLVTVRNMPEFINADEIFRDYAFESAFAYNNLKLKQILSVFSKLWNYLHAEQHAE